MSPKNSNNSNIILITGLNVFLIAALITNLTNGDNKRLSNTPDLPNPFLAVALLLFIRNVYDVVKNGKNCWVVHLWNIGLMYAFSLISTLGHFQNNHSSVLVTTRMLVASFFLAISLCNPFAVLFTRLEKSFGTKIVETPKIVKRAVKRNRLAKKIRQSSVAILKAVTSNFKYDSDDSTHLSTPSKWSRSYCPSVQSDGKISQATQTTYVYIPSTVTQASKSCQANKTHDVPSQETIQTNFAVIVIPSNPKSLRIVESTPNIPAFFQNIRASMLRATGRKMCAVKRAPDVVKMDDLIKNSEDLQKQSYVKMDVLFKQKKFTACSEVDRLQWFGKKKSMQNQ